MTPRRSLKGQLYLRSNTEKRNLILERTSLCEKSNFYFKFCKEGYTLLHLDHIPAIDEDQKNVDFLPLLKRALDAGYQSVMIDGSRLPLAQNIAVTQQAAELAAKYL